ncbi:15374_t:CDS:2 [Entrophospora sp. SA101]|nr:15374_t:CDS:2 [Entrophospora sp. SA101]
MSNKEIVEKTKNTTSNRNQGNSNIFSIKSNSTTDNQKNNTQQQAKQPTNASIFFKSDFYDLNDVSTKRNKCKSPETKLDLWIKRPPKTADNNNQSATEQKQKHGMKVDDNKCVKHDDDLIIDDDEIIDSLSSFSASKKIISNKNTLEFNQSKLNQSIYFNKQPLESNLFMNEYKFVDEKNIEKPSAFARNDIKPENTSSLESVPKQKKGNELESQDDTQYTVGRYRIHPTGNTSHNVHSSASALDQPGETTPLIQGIRPTIPFPKHDPGDKPGGGGENVNHTTLSFIKKLFGYYASILSSSSELNNTDISNLPNHDERPFEINFWFFLFFYYGFYNAIALLMITKVFDLYSLNWWPKKLGGVSAYTMFWLLSLAGGVLIYEFTEFERYNMTWVLLTFLTMCMPLIVAFTVIRRQNRNTYRKSLTPAQKTFLETELQSRIPASYIRFLWFSAILFMIMIALIAGESYAFIFLTTKNHTGIDAFVYVYSWLATVYILDTITDYVIETRVKSNLFARLRDPGQYIIIQAASSLWVCIFYPLCMTQTVHRYLVTYVGLQKDYETYQKQCGRSFFIRNLAENATMLGFLGWLCIIHYGPNYEVYPYFKFVDENKELDIWWTLKATCKIWAFELISAKVTRIIYEKYFKINIRREAVADFKKYPEMVVAMLVIIIHVLQDMLMALLSMNFEGGRGAKTITPTLSSI